MEHLLCLTPDDLHMFMITTEMEYEIFSDRILLYGESIFTWVWNESLELFCFKNDILEEGENLNGN